MNQQSTAVATRPRGSGDMTAEQKEAPLPVAVRHELEARADALALSLPGHMNYQEFINLVTMAVAEDPEIMICTKRSIVTAAMKAAADGLKPDKREGAFVAYNVKVSKKGQPDRWQKEAKWMPMVYGIIKKVRQSGEVKSLTAHVAYANDEFDYELGDNERLIHKPVMRDRGDPLCAYAIAKLDNGEIVREIVDLDDLEKIRAVNRAAGGDSSPWAKWWSEMARKSAVRRLSKWLPMSKEVEGVLRHDDEHYDLSLLDDERRRPITNEQIRRQATGGALAAPIDTGEVTDVEPEEEGAQVPGVFNLVGADGEVVLETESAGAWVTAYCDRTRQIDDFQAGVAFMQANAEAAQIIVGEGLVDNARDVLIEAQNAMRDRCKAAQAQGDETARGDQQDAGGYEDDDPGPGAEAETNPWLVDFPERPKNSGALMPALQLCQKKIGECKTRADLDAFDRANRGALTSGMAKNLSLANDIVAELDRRLAE